MGTFSLSGGVHGKNLYIRSSFHLQLHCSAAAAEVRYDRCRRGWGSEGTGSSGEHRNGSGMACRLQQEDYQLALADTMRLF
jgi:hypothetical protein